MKVTNFTPLPLDLQGWNSNANTFHELIEEVKPKTIIEIGTWKGASAITMAHACQKLGLETKIYCIDTWLGALEFKNNFEKLGAGWDTRLLHGYPQIYYQFLSNIIHEGVVDMIEAVPNTSENAVSFVPDADLIYVDGQHTYKGCTEDLGNYFAKLRKGGIIFGDDYNLKTDKIGGIQWSEVEKAVDDFSERNHLSVEIRENNFWIIRKQ